MDALEDGGVLGHVRDGPRIRCPKKSCSPSVTAVLAFPSPPPSSPPAPPPLPGEGGQGGGPKGTGGDGAGHMSGDSSGEGKAKGGEEQGCGRLAKGGREVGEVCGGLEEGGTGGEGGAPSFPP